MTVPMRDGSVVADPRLGRLPQRDDRNMRFLSRSLLGERTPRSYTWACTTYNDQLQEGACVGFGFGHEIAARPVSIPFTADQSRKVYHRAQDLDPWPGTNYDGTSVLAGAKAATEAGYYGEYRWALTVDDALVALSYSGPIVLGISWYERMFDTDSAGFIHRGGELAGGHCLLATGLSVTKRVIRLHNSWGRSWGMGGDCFLTFDDFRTLMAEPDADCCVPVRRLRP